MFVCFHFKTGILSSSSHCWDGTVSVPQNCFLSMEEVFKMVKNSLINVLVHFINVINVCSFLRGSFESKD